jgi:hypothetical protein
MNHVALIAIITVLVITFTVLKLKHLKVYVIVNAQINKTDALYSRM